MMKPCTRTRPAAPTRILLRSMASVCVLALAIGCATTPSTPQDASVIDPLPSWSTGPAKTAILEFVAAVTELGGEDYVAPEERIATFDNDGTLWLEYPMYTQFLFALERLKELAPQHPEWQTTQPYQAALTGDMKTLGEAGTAGILEIVMATHAGMTEAAFEQEVTKWLSATRDERFNRLYTELVYQPQLELLEYLRTNGFKTFIVSGGGQSFMRPWTDRVYGIPPEQVVGSTIVVEYQMVDGKPAFMRMPEVGFIDDKDGKPVAILQHIGRRPLLAFGNSDGDYEMVQYTTEGPGRRLGLFVHHTDALREYAYDRDSHVGKLDKALDDAAANGWIIVSMKTAWRTVFPDE